MSLEIITLEDQHAETTARVLSGFGMNCYSFEVPTTNGRFDVLWSVDGFCSGSQRASSSGIPLLFPFVGRLQGTQFQHEGQTYAFTEGDGIGNAIHGLVIDRPWKVIQREPQRLVGCIESATNRGKLKDCWPADYRVCAAYELTAMRLSLTITIENVDQRPLPFGFGTHPYFRVPREGDWRVTVPAKGYWPLDAMLPTGNQLHVDSRRDLRCGRPFDEIHLDDVLGDLIFEDEICDTQLTNQENGERIVQSFDEGFRECVVYTPPHREAICIEPYTCVPNAAELARNGVNAGWQVLAPGQRWQSRIEIRYEAAQ